MQNLYVMQMKFVVGYNYCQIKVQREHCKGICQM